MGENWGDWRNCLSIPEISSHDFSSDPARNGFVYRWKALAERHNTSPTTGGLIVKLFSSIEYPSGDKESGSPNIQDSQSQKW